MSVSEVKGSGTERTRVLVQEKAPSGSLRRPSSEKRYPVERRNGEPKVAQHVNLEADSGEEEARTHRYTKARMLSMVATSGWPRPDVRSKSSSACLQRGTATS